MDLLTLQFASILELVDFQTIIQCAIDQYNLAEKTLTASFSEADIELAKAAYNAVLVDGK